MDGTFITGAAATVASILIFCGSVWLVLAMVLGSRLAYFVSASVTLAFMLIMGVVWSINPLGPLGESPSFSETAIGSGVSQFGYPEGDWYTPPEDDEQQAAIVSELEGAATDALELAIEEEAEGVEFEDVGDAIVNQEASRLIEVDGTMYGATVLEPTELVAESEDPPDAVTVVMEYDPGNLLGVARWITLFTALLLGVHLFLLGRAERTVKARPGAEVA
jgi:hypothetical protein